MGRKTEVPGPRESTGPLKREQEIAPSQRREERSSPSTPAGWRFDAEVYRSLVEQLPAIAYVSEYGAGAPWHFVSPKIEALLGIPAEAWLKNPALRVEAMHPEDRAKALAAEEEAQRTGKPLRCEYRLRRRDGSYRWFRDEAVALENPRGGAPLLHGVLYDIHESKQNERALRESQERLNLALSASGVSFWDCDVANGEVYLDESWPNIVGGERRATRATLEQLFSITHPDDRARIYELGLRAIRGQADEYAADHRVRGADGRWIWIHSRGRVVARQPDGRAARMMGVNWDVSQRKEAEEALRESEQRLRLALEGSEMGAFEMDVRTSSVSWDSHGGQLFQFPEKLKGRPFAELLYRMHPEDHGKINAAVEAAVKDGEPFRLEFRIVLDDGRVEWRTVHGRAIREAHGEIVRLIAIGADISERKRAEEALQRSEERYRALYEDNVAGLVISTQDGKMLDCNQAVLERYGYASKAEMLAANVGELYADPQDRTRLLEKLRADGQVDNFETRHLRKDGSVIWVLRSARLVANPEGGAPLIFGTAVDITKRKDAEAALRESEERLRLALHAADMGVWEWDAATNHTTWDAGLHRIMGVASGKFDGSLEATASLIHPEDRETFLNAVDQAANHGEVYQVDFRVVRPDGRTVWIADRGRPEYDRAGKLLRFRGVARDVTRPRELQQQLERAQKMEAVGQLAGGVAHDFNNLLMVIRGNTEVLREHAAENPEYARNLEAVLQAADRAANITRQLLAFSRRQMLQPKVVELGSIVSETAGLLRRVIGPAIQLQLEISSEGLYARVDASQLDQVVVNLVINARDAMPEGGKVTVRVDRAAADSESVTRVRFPQMPDVNYVRLTVTDTGTGMDAATQARIFEPFFTTKEMGKGTGLGLATVYGIVKQSEGWIWVDSEPGKGTSFEVFLPQVAAPQQAEAGPSTRSSELRGTETLVVVDDEEDILELAMSYLAGLGYEVIAASSGDQALEKIGAHAGPIDALITDAQMPGTPGLRLAQTVRAARPDIRVLYMSGYAEDSGIPERLPRGGEDFLQKPFELRELATKIRDLLRK